MKCPNCGSEAVEGSAFCTNCGTRLEAEQAVSVPQTPQVNEIPEPPQMPDIPTPPMIPSEQAPEAPDTPQPPPPYGAPDTPQPPPPYGAPDTMQPPPPYGVPPQQPYYQQPGAAYPQQPGYQSVSEPKKSKTGLILGIAGGVVAVIIIAIVAVILLSRGVIGGGGSTDAADLYGTWEYDSGSFVYFFGQSKTIMFFENAAGADGVYEADHGEWGSWHIRSSDSKLVVDGELSGVNEFTFNIRRDRLTITDEDGDTIHYNRVSDTANAPNQPGIIDVTPAPDTPDSVITTESPPTSPETNETPAPDPQAPPPADIPTTQLLGRWELDSNTFSLYFFGESDYILFSEEDGKFRVYESDLKEWGTVTIESNNMTIQGDETGFYSFTIELDGDKLTINDSFGDVSVYVKAE